MPPTPAPESSAALTLAVRQNPPRRPSQRGIPTAVLAVVLLAVLALNVETTVVNVALPTLNRELGATTAQLQGIVDAYNLPLAGLVLAGGGLGYRVCLLGAGSVTAVLPSRPTAPARDAGERPAADLEPQVAR